MNPMPPPDLFSDWWGEAFAPLPYESSAPGENEMLSIVAYDIRDQKRLQRVAKVCCDYGVRVQYSIFECHLEEPAFERFWDALIAEIDPENDRIVAYKLDAKNAKQTMSAGQMVCSERVVCYMV